MDTLDDFQSREIAVPFMLHGLLSCNREAFNRCAVHNTWLIGYRGPTLHDPSPGNIPNESLWSPKYVLSRKYVRSDMGKTRVVVLQFLPRVRGFLLSRLALSLAVVCQCHWHNSRRIYCQSQEVQIFSLLNIWQCQRGIGESLGSCRW